MKINKLIDSFEDDSFSLYQLQKESLLKGIVLDYSFIRINPFSGINRRLHSFFIEEDEVDTGLYSFLFNTGLFSVVNSDARIVYFDRIALFVDEFYEIKLISGTYQTAPICLKLNDIKGSTFFEDDELILNLLKKKNIKIHFKLKHSGENRKKIEERLQMENGDNHAQELLKRFLSKISDRQLEKDNTAPLYLDLLKVSYNPQSTKEEMISKFKNLEVKDIRIKKDLLYMNLLFNHINRLTFKREDMENLINKTQKRYDSIKNDMKILDYKLKAKYITIKDSGI